MSQLFQEPEQRLTAAQVKEWIDKATRKRLGLHLLAMQPSNNAPEQAFEAMGTLCQDAIEEVRVMSAQLGDENQVLRSRSAALLADAARLLNIFQDDRKHRGMPK